MQKHNEKDVRQEQREKIILSNVDLVHSIAHKYTVSERYAYDDLFQQGMIGLINAANTFDDNKGVKFATYAYKVVENAILDFIYANVSPFSYPKSAGRNYLKANKNEQKLQENVNNGQKLKTEICRVVSLDAEHDETCLINMIMDPAPLPEDKYIEHETILTINQALLKLTPADRKLIQSYFGFNTTRKTLCVLAQEYNISRQAVSDRIRVVLNKLKSALEKTKS